VAQTELKVQSQLETLAELECTAILHLHNGNNASYVMEHYMKLNNLMQEGVFVFSNFWYYWKLLFMR
jgi:hypothetical protein